MLTADMLKSMANVEKTRNARMSATPARMGAEEKDRLLREYHPDYRESGFTVLSTGPNKGSKVPTELAELLQANSRIKSTEIDLGIHIFCIDIAVL